MTTNASNSRFQGTRDGKEIDDNDDDEGEYFIANISCRKKNNKIKL